MFPLEHINPLKKDKVWHKDYVQAAWREWEAQGHQSFLKGRQRYAEIESYANGAQSIEKYKKWAEVTEDKQTTFMNIDWKPIPIIPKYLRQATDRLGKFDFKISANAVDPLAHRDRKEYEDTQKARIRTQEILSLAGLDPTSLDGEEFDEPHDIRELNIKMNFGYKHNMAIDIEKRVDAVFQDSRIKEKVRQLRRDLIRYGAGILKDDYDPIDEKAVVKYVRLDDFMCSSTRDPYFRDLTYAGHIEYLTLGEIKEIDKGKDITGTDYERVAEAFAGKDGNPKLQDVNSIDSLKVPVLNMEFLTENKYDYEKRTDKRGNPVIGKYDADKKKKKKDREYYRKTRICRHEVKYILDTDVVFAWGEAYNKRKVKKKWDTQLTYHVVCPELSGMETTGLIEQMMPHVDQIHLAWYKLQNVQMMARPKGVAIEIGSMEDISLGSGMEEMSPMRILDLLYQKGVLVYRRIGLDGESTNYKPIEELEGGLGNQAMEWFDVIDRHMMSIKSLIGFNDLTDGSTPDPKTLNGVAAMAQEMTNNALHYIIDAERNLIERVADSVAIRVHDIIAFMGSKAYDHVLSPSTLKSIREDKDHIHREYAVHLEYDVDPYEEQKVEKRIELALQSGQITIADDAYISNIRNIKQREMVLAYRVEKNMMEQRKKAQEEQQMNAQVQMQSAQAAEEEKRKTKEMEIQQDIARIQAEHQSKRELLILEHQLKSGIKDKELQGMREKEEIEADAQIESTLIKEESKNMAVSK